MLKDVSTFLTGLARPFTTKRQSRVYVSFHRKTKVSSVFPSGRIRRVSIFRQASTLFWTDFDLRPPTNTRSAARVLLPPTAARHMMAPQYMDPLGQTGFGLPWYAFVHYCCLDRFDFDIFTGFLSIFSER